MGAVGLCGDMNGERSADLKTPPMCVLRPRLAALSFMLNKSGAQAGFERCSGLPAALKEEFVRESTKCPREVIIPTPVSKLHGHISALNIPMKPGMKHIVDKQSNQLCVSKQMVKSCLSKPVSIKKKSVEFACIPQPSVKASSLEKRALSVGLSSRRSLSSQLFSARKSWRPLPAALTFPLDMVITSGIVMTANIFLFG